RAHRGAEVRREEREDLPRRPFERSGSGAEDDQRRVGAPAPRRDGRRHLHPGAELLQRHLAPRALPTAPPSGLPRTERARPPHHTLRLPAAVSEDVRRAPVAVAGRGDEATVGAGETHARLDRAPERAVPVEPGEPARELAHPSEDPRVALEPPDRAAEHPGTPG